MHPILTPPQAVRLREQIAWRLRYINRLRARLEAVGFPPKDPLYLAALRASSALQELLTHAHYASCPSGAADVFPTE